MSSSITGNKLGVESGIVSNEIGNPESGSDPSLLVELATESTNQEETGLPTAVANYYQSWKQWMWPESQPTFSRLRSDIEMGNVESGVQQKAPFDFDAHKAQWEKIREKKTDIRNNTLSWRVTGKELGLTDKNDHNKPYDLIVGIKDGKLCYAVSSDQLRGVPADMKTQVGVALALAAASAASYYTFGEGIVTRGLLTSFCSFVIPKLESIPYVPQLIGPMAATTAAYFVTQAADNNMYVRFSFVVGLGLCAMLYKKSGKALSTGGWASFKKYVIPMGITESGIRALPTRVVNWCRGTAQPDAHLDHSREHHTVCTLPLPPIKGGETTPSIPASLNLSVFDGEMYYSLALGEGENQKKFPPIKMADKDDDDDDDDDDEVKKVKDKKKDAIELKGEELILPANDRHEIGTGGLKQEMTREFSDAHEKAAAKEQSGKVEKKKKKKDKEKVKEPVDVETDPSTETVQKTSNDLILEPIEKVSKAKKKKKKKKDQEAPSLVQRAKEGALFVLSGVATGVSKYYLGEGITTDAINKIFTASVKAKCRLMPLANSYGLLTMASGAVLLVKMLQPDSFVGDLSFIPISILTSTANKDIKDRIVTGKDPKNTDLYEVPVTVQKIGNRLFGYTPKPIVEREDLFAFVLDDENKGELGIKFNARKVSPENPDTEIEAVVKISNKKLTGKYNLSKDDQLKLHLARMKAKKLGAGPEAAFIVTSIGATLLASYLTKMYQEGSFIGDPTQIKAEKLGEGVVTNILNSVLATYLKQFGKKIPPVPRDGGLLLTSVGAIALERFLMAEGKLPMLFSSIPTSGFLAIQSKKAKQWVYGKPYGKTEGWITKDGPTGASIASGWESLKKTAAKLFCCKDEAELKNKMDGLAEDGMVLMQRTPEGSIEVAVLSQTDQTLPSEVTVNLQH
ncbi:MAG: hypothetical protein JSS60_05615 [Verrucomicrobia bacterium]|nr:hypothetical protein [Verrucomicrobiota bacterium]